MILILIRIIKQQYKIVNRVAVPSVPFSVSYLCPYKQKRVTQGEALLSSFPPMTKLSCMESRCDWINHINFD